MNIAILTSATPHSAMTHRMVALGRELVLRGHSVTIVAPSADKYSNWQIDKPTAIDGIAMAYPFQFRTRIYWLNLAPYLMSASLALFRLRPDVVYVSKPTPVTIMAVLARYLGHAPLILDLDDWGSEVMRREGRSAIVVRLVAACEWLLAREARAIVVVSSYLYQEFTRRFSGRKAIYRVPNGVDPTELRPSQPASDRSPKLIFLGALERPEIFRAILEPLPDVISRVGSDSVQLEILGDGPGRAQLESRARQLGVSGNVRFRGWITLDQLSKYAAAGDIGLCVMPDEPSVAACSNQKLFQYQALQLATVVTAVGDLPEYVGGGVDGVVVPAGDTKALADVLTELLTNNENRQRLSQRARILAETRYSWSLLAGQLEDVLKAAI